MIYVAPHTLKRHSKLVGHAFTALIWPTSMQAKLFRGMECLLNSAQAEKQELVLLQIELCHAQAAC